MAVELFLLVISLLFFASIFTDKLSSRLGVPALLLFLLVGMLFGEDGLGIEFEDVRLAQAFSTVALCVILFQGGLGTKIRDIKPVIHEGACLALMGVLLTCLFSGVLIYYILRWTNLSREVSLAGALLMAATMSSTDAASVFSILRTKGIALKHNLKPLLELESGSNDPMAYILTTTLISIVNAAEGLSWWRIGLTIVWQIIAGVAVGFLFGKFIIYLMRKVRLSNSSLYPLLILTACIFIFSATYFIGGNSFLAVYIGGIVIGNSKFAHKRHSMNFFDGVSWLCQLSMFLILGLLITPHNLQDAILPGLIVSVVMIFIARPAAVFLTMWPFKYYNWQDKTFLSWVGLKGAVPIILGIQCIAANVPEAHFLFHIAFFCTLISLLLQGATLEWVAKRLHLDMPNQESIDPTHFDIDLPEEVLDQAVEMCLTPMQARADGSSLLKDLSLPVGSLVMLIRRGDAYIVPKGHTPVFPGDYLLLISEDHSALIHTDEMKIWELDFIDHPIDFISHLGDKPSHDGASSAPDRQDAPAPFEAANYPLESSTEQKAPHNSAEHDAH